MSVATMPRFPLLVIALLSALPSAAAAQEPTPIGYPERDILSPFRDPADLYAPPDELFQKLRLMQAIASKRPDLKSFDEDGREVIDDETWRRARAEATTLGLQAGHLAQMMRLHRNAFERETAFYGAFYVADIDYVIELIAHIPGEPVRRIREAAMPRAIEFLKKHLNRRFGDLTPDQQETLKKALPEPGSPVARAQGMMRSPEDTDPLHTLLLRPFLQLLDVDNEVDQAQALWFLKEVFRIRKELALFWVEPSLPRVRQLLLSDEPKVRTEAIGLLQAIGPDDLPPPPSTDATQADKGALLDWAEQAAKALFPPIRNLNDAVVQLHPSPERDAIVKAGIEALQHSAIGDPYRGQLKDGSWYRGFRVGHVPDELRALAIPAESVITSVNGAAIGSAQELLQTIELQLQNKRRPLQLLVEYVRKDKQHAIEFRIM